MKFNLLETARTARAPTVPTRPTSTTTAHRAAPLLDAGIAALRYAVVVILAIAATIVTGLATIYIGVQSGGMAAVLVVLAGATVLAATTRLLFDGPSFTDSARTAFRWG